MTSYSSVRAKAEAPSSRTEVAAVNNLFMVISPLWWKTKSAKASRALALGGALWLVVLNG
jgi:hypothetical protein